MDFDRFIRTELRVYSILSPAWFAFWRSDTLFGTEIAMRRIKWLPKHGSDLPAYRHS
jgi:hypothetical protein